RLSLLGRPCVPSSTLFPYTTLFRSFLMAFTFAVSICRGNGNTSNSFVPTLLLVLVKENRQLRTLEFSRPTITLMSRSTLLGTTEDRKSTRLNSSHQIISYAVFCLKI